MTKKEEESNLGEDSNEESSGKRKMTAREREELLVENFVGIQHVMTNLSIKFGALTDSINKLLEVFEEAAKKFATEEVDAGSKEILEKIDALLDQNKTLAKGLVLMEGRLRGHTSPPPMENRSQGPHRPPQSQARPSDSFPRPRPLPSL